MKGINPDASWEAIMEVIYALAPLLEFPVVDVQKVTSRKIIFYEDSAPATPSVALAVPVETEFFPTEPVDSLDMAEQRIAIWEEMARQELEKQAKQAKFVLALMYMLWVWKTSRLRPGMGRAPPVPLF